MQDGGITEFTSKLSNSYTKYYNIKHNRIGPLFQGEFKAVLVENDQQLIHLNPIAAFLVKNPEDYEWSSYREYLNEVPGVCKKEEILDFFKSSEDYRQFVLDQASYAQELAVIKHNLIDEED